MTFKILIQFLQTAMNITVWAVRNKTPGPMRTGQRGTLTERWRAMDSWGATKVATKFTIGSLGFALFLNTAIMRITKSKKNRGMKQKIHLNSPWRTFSRERLMRRQKESIQLEKTTERSTRIHLLFGKLSLTTKRRTDKNITEKYKGRKMVVHRSNLRRPSSFETIAKVKRMRKETANVEEIETLGSNWLHIWFHKLK